MPNALRLIATALLVAPLGCVVDEEPSEQVSVVAEPLAVQRQPRSTLRTVGTDTLTEAVRILDLFPEPDATAIAVVFTDSITGVSSGLALTQRDREEAALLWPDSVTAVWWPAPHSVAFTTRTGAGVQVVVDVHAAELRLLRQDTTQVRRAAEPTAPAVESRARAQSFIDSVRVQPEGVPQGSALRYEVGALLPAPTGSLAAFYVAARDGRGGQSNPAWYFLDTRTGAIELVDEVIGAAREMPEEAAGWAQTGEFVYAKGATVYGAIPVATAPAP